MSAPSPRTLVPFAGLAVIAAVWIQTPATAKDLYTVPNGRTAEVAVADLNLADPAHVELLDKRIQNAAKTVCAPKSFNEYANPADRITCVRAAVASASPKRDRLVASAQTSQMAARSGTGSSIN